MRLHAKLMIFICMVVILMAGLFEFTFKSIMETNLKKDKGMQALSVAETISYMPEISEAFLLENPSETIQPIAEKIRREVEAEFIVVGNLDEIRYSHPDEDRIGEKMVGGDNDKVLKGETIVSESTGTLGPSLRGKAPIFDQNGTVIGVVSVGFLQEDIARELSKLQNKILFSASLILVGGIISALLISLNIKKAIFGLEPQEIAWMYQEKHAILESIHEGIIAIDTDGKITVVNENAHKILQIPNEILLRGKRIEEIIKDTHLLQVAASGQAEYDQEFIILEEVFVVNRIPIFDKRGIVAGAVASFRNKSELSHVLQELSHVKAYAEGLRAQTHEYSNRLYTLLGLIQLGSYKEAIDFISTQVNVTQGFISFIMREIPDPILAGFILGKISLASEMKIEFLIDEGSSFQDVPDSLNREAMITIIGNLINNAFDAVRENEVEDKKVCLFLTDLGKELIIEVEDNGPGIDPGHFEQIFQQGFSTKSGGRNAGIGLNLVQQALKTAGGTITFTTERGAGTMFTVAIPKKQGG